MSTNLVVPNLKKEINLVSIYGIRPLLCQRLAREKPTHTLPKWPTVMGKVEDKLAWEHFIHHLYVDKDDDIAFPAVAIKKASVDAGRVVPGKAMTQIKGLFYVNGSPPYGYTKIRSYAGNNIPVPSKFVQDESNTFRWHGMSLMNHPFVDLVHKQKGGAIPVVYAQIELPWRIDVEVEYASAITNLQEIVEIMEYAGDFVGIGCRRPERSGQGDYGRFTLSQSKAIAEYKKLGIDPKLYS